MITSISTINERLTDKEKRVKTKDESFATIIIKITASVRETIDKTRSKGGTEIRYRERTPAL